MDIFLARNNEQAGPYTLNQVNTMLATGEVVLTDLAWHAGMAQWQPLGELTSGQNYYTGAPAKNPPPRDHWAKPPKNEVQPSEVNLDKLSKEPALPVEQYELASVTKRLMAVLLDQLLFLLILMPAIPYISVSLAEFQALDSPEKMMKFYEGIVAGLPSTVQGFIGISIILVFLLQIFLLVTRGQSIGKLLLCIRIVDIDSLKVPSVTNVFLLRTVLTNISYNVPVVGPIVFLIDCFMLFFAEQNRTLHDKLAKTKVVMADDKQIKKEL